MTIKKQVDKLDDVPEALREFYVEATDSGGATVYNLATDEASRIGEFRTRNIKVLKENEQLTADLAAKHAQLSKFDGMDVDKYNKAAKALELIEGDEERKLIEEGKIDEVIQRRMKTAIESHGNQVHALTVARDTAIQERDDLRTSVDRTALRTAVQTAVDKDGIRLRSTGAMHDLHARIAGDFTIDPETGTPKARNGEFGPKGEPLTINDRIVALAGSADASHLFETAGGSGSSGSRRPTLVAGVRIIDPDDPVAIGLAADDIHAGKAKIGKG